MFDHIFKLIEGHQILRQVFYFELFSWCLEMTVVKHGLLCLILPPRLTVS